MRYAEELHWDGTIDVDSTVAAQIKSAGLGGPGAPPVAWQEDRFTCRGDGVEIFEPRFCWHGFRYVEITGLPKAPLPEEITGIRWNTDLPRVSSFECSNPLLNRIQEVIEWTLLSNAFGILSEDIHPQTGALWGNLPQTYSMAGVINSAMNLSRGWEEAWSPNEDIATPPGRHPREGNGP